MPDSVRILACNLDPVLTAILSRLAPDGVTFVPFEGDARDLETCRQQAACDVVVVQVPLEVDDETCMDLATRGVWNLVTTTQARRVVLLSTMRLFDGLDEGWAIDERWSPRPSTDVSLLAPYLAECALRETARDIPVEAVVLRLDQVVAEVEWRADSLESTWIHVDDAANAILAAVTGEDFARWMVQHIVRGDERSRYQRYPQRRPGIPWEPAYLDHRSRSEPIAEPQMPDFPGPVTDLEPPQSVAILGAAGPLAVATAMQLGADIRLRLADRRPLAEVAGGEPQSPGAPLPDVALLPPHEEVALDVTDYASVRRAMEGMDTVVNCTVVRPDPVQAFRVNTLGAWNVMRAAAELGIRRVVHTGPILNLAPYPIGMEADRDIHAITDRPGSSLYILSKYLGKEIVRIYAETLGMAVPSLHFDLFTPLDPEVALRRGSPCTISWSDAGRAVLAAARIETMPKPFVAVNVLAPSPHDRWDAMDAQRLLNWEPQDQIDLIWYRSRA
jgi:nucleoside-diphosphate-sugar epimerase